DNALDLGILDADVLGDAGGLELPGGLGLLGRELGTAAAETPWAALRALARLPGGGRGTGGLLGRLVLGQGREAQGRDRDAGGQEFHTAHEDGLREGMKRRSGTGRRKYA